VHRGSIWLTDHAVGILAEAAAKDMCQGLWRGFTHGAGGRGVADSIHYMQVFLEYLLEHLSSKPVFLELRYALVGSGGTSISY
jgi:hypothetical protein